MTHSIRVEVVNFGQGGEGSHRAGMAVVSFDGNVVARLLTSESVEFTVGPPAITMSPHP